MNHLYLPKWASLSGSSPIHGGASSESKLLNGDDGTWPGSADSVNGTKVRYWDSNRGFGGLSVSDTRAQGNGAWGLEGSIGM